MSRRRQLDLSDQQHRVLDLMAHGRTNYDIARDLGVSLDGAKYHVRQVFDKLGVDSREEAITAWRESRGSLLERVRGFLWPVGAIAAGGVAVVAVVVIGALALGGTFRSTNNAGNGGSIPAGVWVAMITQAKPAGSLATGDLEIFEAGDKQAAKVFNGNYIESQTALEWSPDGKHLAVTVSPASDTRVLRIFTRDGTTWTHTDIPISSYGVPVFSWSPNSDLISMLEPVFTSTSTPASATSTPTGLRFDLLNAAGKTLSSIEAPVETVATPIWVKDGQMAVWQGQANSSVVLTPSSANFYQQAPPTAIVNEITRATPFPQAPRAGATMIAKVNAALPDAAPMLDNVTADGSGTVFLGYSPDKTVDDLKVAVVLPGGKVQVIDLGERQSLPAGTDTLGSGFDVVVTK